MPRPPLRRVIIRKATPKDSSPVLVAPLIGFSRTCHVLEDDVSKTSLHLYAAALGEVDEVIQLTLREASKVLPCPHLLTRSRRQFDEVLHHQDFDRNSEGKEIGSPIVVLT
ncbi:hypothetical protein D3C87_1583740 [compost metagenome]